MMNDRHALTDIMFHLEENDRTQSESGPASREGYGGLSRTVPYDPSFPLANSIGDPGFER